MRLSVVIITKNEEANVERCLSSVAWADEIVVVDSQSSDRTVEIARADGARVVETTDWPGFGPQKNRALAQAGGEWVLSLDADERVTPELRDEIMAIVSGGAEFDAYDIPRLSSYCGHFMRHSGWWPDYVTRLVRRGKARFSDDLVHERLVVDATTGRLKHHLVHHAFEDFEEVLRKVDQYSSANARMLRERGHSGSLSRALLHGCWAFVRTYVLRAGFLDGRHGFMLAVSNAEGTYYRYLKLMLLEEKR
ncbi:MAG: glycosyltransferase family 2 protein [Pseudomonadota bacterium]